MTQSRSELLINAIDLSPYVTGLSETGNILGILAPPELVHELFLDIRLGRMSTIIFYNGKLLDWYTLDPDQERGWITLEIRSKTASGQFEDYKRFWLRFDEL